MVGKGALDLLLASIGGGPFDLEVWSALPTLIPYGATITYGENAAGRANAINPISLVVPCHRVLGAGGRLVGYGDGEA